MKKNYVLIDYENVQPSAVTASKTIPECVSAVISNPRTLKTLSSTINALFQKTLSQTEVDNIIDELSKRGVVTVKQTKVSYSLPSEPE